MPYKNILICSAGRRVSLVNYFKSEVKNLIGGDVKVFTTDLDPSMSAACHHSDGSFKVGRFADEDYMGRMLQICVENKIGIVIPTLDTELILLAQHKEQFLKKGIFIIVSSLDIITTLRDKNLTNQFFMERGFKLPKLVDKNNPTFPLFVKPVSGSSSFGLHFIKSAKEISEYLFEKSGMIWMEYLDSKEYEEYTIDLYYNRRSLLKCVVPRVRIAVRGGETNKGITKKDQGLISFVKDNLGYIEGAYGCFTLQVFKGRMNNKIYGIEINPRFGGGYPLSYLAGANYPRWIIEEYLLKKDIATYEDWEDQLLLLRYDYEFLVHSDDVK